MKTSKPDKNWLVATPSLDDSGHQIFTSKGEKVTKSIQMAPGRFNDGTPQSFYFPPGHWHAGLFKGMRIILEERGFPASSFENLKRECKSFHCPAGQTDCCMRRRLYSQPDFQNVKSVLEDHCNQRGVEVFFLPKFHPELNPIEQCWGRAKWYYCKLPLHWRRTLSGMSWSPWNQSRLLSCVGKIISFLHVFRRPVDIKRRFANRTIRFMDIYRKGLSSQEAAWAAKRYRSHRALPPSWRKDIEG